MEAMILAAGEGTRLRPLTHKRPKPLIPVMNTPLLEITLSYLKDFSFKRILINSHHLADQITDFIAGQKKRGGLELEVQFEPEILGTGGGMARSRDFWHSRTFLVINGDILTDINLTKVVGFHLSHGGPATLVLHDYPAFNQITVDARGRIERFRTEPGKGLAFTGIHILDQEIFRYLTLSGSFDIIPVYQKMIEEGQPVWAFISRGHYWRDLGTPKSYLKIHEELLNKEFASTPTPSLPPLWGRLRRDLSASSSRVAQSSRVREGGEINKRSLANGRRVLIHPEAEVEEGVKFTGWAVIGKGCRLKKGCRIADSILWEQVVLEEGVSVANSIVGKGVRVDHDLMNKVLV